MNFANDIIYNMNETKIFCTDFFHYLQSNKLNLYNPDIINARNSYQLINFFQENTTLHNHYSLEIQFIIKGNLTIFANKKEYIVGAGNMILIPAGLNHCCFDISDNFERYSFLFSVKKLTAKNSREYTFLNQLASYDKIEIFTIQKQTIELLSSINTYAGNISSFYNSHIIQSLFSLLLFSLGKQILPEQITNESYRSTFDSPAQRKSKIEHFLYSVRNENPSLKDVAEYLGLSTRQTARVIFAYFNLNFSQLITKIKMEEAKYLIENTNLNKNVISSSLGYSSYFTFYKTYKKYYGKAPSSISPKDVE